MRALFVDESKKDRFVLAVTSIDAADVPTARRRTAGLRHPGQKRVHFLKENPSRRRLILTEMSGLPTETTLFVATGMRDLDARRACLEALVGSIQDDVRSLVLELDERTVEHDRRLLYRSRISEPFTYRHERASHEPLLWIPDAVAWCFARGGDWGRRAAPLIGRVEEIR